ncbi:MAG: lipoyl(octanoyl) transferase LipB [Proteobacteria bacterium]|nr:lipoyl(octanoyl) transferase LipB [Pseudomonadota bacterium]
MSKSQVSQILIRDLGLMRYGEAIREQERAHANVLAGGLPVIFTVQHCNVLTMGKNASKANLMLSCEHYRQLGVEIIFTDRGGEVTAHVPGQLVVYPVIPILKMGLTVRSYVSLLEECVIEALEEYGLIAGRDEKHPGVWIGPNKICAIGIRIKSRVAMHGFALNVNNSLDLFHKIVPCGIQNRGVTTMAMAGSQMLAMEDVRIRLLDRLMKKLDCVPA